MIYVITKATRVRGPLCIRMFIYTKITSVNTGELLERDRPDTNTVQTPAEPTGGVVGSLAGYSRVRIERIF